MKLSRWDERAKQWQYMDDSFGQIGDRTYNLIMGGVVVYGLIVNFLLCLFFGSAIETINPIFFLLVYFICCFGGIMLTRSTDNPAVSFLGYNLVVLPVGMVVSSCVYVYGGISSSVVWGAFYYTGLITAIMVLASCLFPGFFSRIGGVLMGCLVGLLLCGLLSMIFPFTGSSYAFFGAIIFSLYIGYDFWRAQQYPRTVNNAIACALDIYLDIVNLFLYIIQIIGRNSGSNNRRSK